MTITDPPNPQLASSDAFRKHGYWDDSTLPGFIDRWADEDPDHALVSDGENTWTYGEFRGAAWRLAGALVEMGTQPGDRVGVQLKLEARALARATRTDDGWHGISEMLAGRTATFTGH